MNKAAIFAELKENLKGRIGIVISHRFSTVRMADRIGRSLQAAEIIVAGGAELYRLALPQAEYLRLTLVDCEPEADAFFPEVDWSQWKELRRETPERGPKDEFALEYVDYRRL